VVYTDWSIIVYHTIIICRMFTEKQTALQESSCFTTAEAMPIQLLHCNKQVQWVPGWEECSHKGGWNLERWTSHYVKTRSRDQCWRISQQDFKLLCKQLFGIICKFLIRELVRWGNKQINNYLFSYLQSHPEVIQAAKDALDKYGAGLSSVRFICGTQVCIFL
jgi:hypothetical protein